MAELQVVCQNYVARELSPAENRVEERPYPVEDGEIRGFSLAPKYSLKQLREIERRRRNKNDSRNG
jgi:hypothetical protein